MSRTYTVGFLGLGHMGGPMAANLVKAGHAVSGFDVVPAALEGAGANGVPVAARCSTPTVAPADSQGC